MKILISDISEEGTPLQADQASNPWWLKVLEEVYQKDYQKGDFAALDLELRKTCENILVAGTSKVHIRPACDRCLELIDQNLEIPIHVDLIPKEEVVHVPGEEVELDEKDLNFAFYEGNTIDLSEVIRDVLALEIPQKSLCSEECRGLCPKCGQNWNKKQCSCKKEGGDPRFAVLKEIKDRIG